MALGRTRRRHPERSYLFVRFSRGRERGIRSTRLLGPGMQIGDDGHRIGPSLDHGGAIGSVYASNGDQRLCPSWRGLPGPPPDRPRDREPAWTESRRRDRWQRSPPGPLPRMQELTLAMGRYADEHVRSRAWRGLRPEIDPPGRHGLRRSAQPAPARRGRSG